MKRGLQKNAISLYFGRIDEVTSLSTEAKDMLKKRFMPDGCARASVRAIAEECGIREAQATGIIVHAIEQIQAWFEQRQSAVEDFDGEDMEFTTTDLALSAALVYCGMHIKDVRVLNERKMEFVFNSNDKEAIDSLTKLYWNNEMTVEPRAYFSAIKNLKGRIYDLQRQTELPQ